LLMCQHFLRTLVFGFFHCFQIRLRSLYMIHIFSNLIYS
jgi:hypothetical protein